MVYWLAGFCLRPFTSLSFLLPRQKLATLLAMLAATFYAGLAGFTLPTLRAVVMSTVLMAVYLTGRKLPVSLRWLLALAAVLSLDPLAPVSQGFWFSFIAVAALLLLIDGSQHARLPDSSFDGGEREQEASDEQGKGIRKEAEKEIGAQDYWRGRFSRAVSTLSLLMTSQLNVFAALLLPLLVWGLPISMLSPFINLLAIPLLGFVIVPLCLLLLPFARFCFPCSLLFPFARFCSPLPAFAFLVRVCSPLLAFATLCSLLVSLLAFAPRCSLLLPFARF